MSTRGSFYLTLILSNHLQLSTIQSYLYILTAILLGVVVILLPPETALLIGGLAAILAVSLMNPVIALSVMLVVAPLRTLIATEAAFRLPLDVGQIAFLGLVGVFLIHIVVDRISIRIPSSVNLISRPFRLCCSRWVNCILCSLYRCLADRMDEVAGCNCIGATHV
jgi:hypothetical protein